MYKYQNHSLSRPDNEVEQDIGQVNSPQTCENEKVFPTLPLVRVGGKIKIPYCITDLHSVNIRIQILKIKIV